MAVKLDAVFKASEWVHAKTRPDTTACGNMRPIGGDRNPGTGLHRVGVLAHRIIRVLTQRNS